MPPGGPLLCGLSRRPYFACREEMGRRAGELATYCEVRISLGSVRRWDKRPSVYQPRQTPEQVAAARMERTLGRPLSVALMLVSACAPPPPSQGWGRGELWWGPIPSPPTWVGYAPPTRAIVARQASQTGRFPVPPSGCPPPGSAGCRGPGPQPRPQRRGVCQLQEAAARSRGVLRTGPPRGRARAQASGHWHLGAALPPCV